MAACGRSFIGLVAETRLSASIGMERGGDHATAGSLRASFAQRLSRQIARGSLLGSSLGPGEVRVDVYAFARRECPRAGPGHYPGFGAAFFWKRALNFFQPRQRSAVRYSLFRGSGTRRWIVRVSSVLRIDIACASRRFAVANATSGNITAPGFLPALPGLRRHDGPDRLARAVGARCPAMRHVGARIAGRGSLAGLYTFLVSCFSSRPAASRFTERRAKPAFAAWPVALRILAKRRGCQKHQKDAQDQEFPGGRTDRSMVRDGVQKMVSETG